MAGSLIKIDEEIVTSAVASVTLIGIDSTYDVYMVRFSDVTLSATDSLQLQFTTSGTPDTTANYDLALKFLKANTTFSNEAAPNLTRADFSSITTSGFYNGVIYCFNFNNASEYSFITFEEVHYDGTNSEGKQGGMVHTVAQACDGVHFKLNGANNISTGQFVLYGLKK